MTDKNDPLEGADVGETRTSRHTTDIWIGDLEPRQWSGTDRTTTTHVTGIREYEDELGDTMLEVELEADITKRLPRRWDYCKEPRTQEEETTERRIKWINRASTALAVLAPIGVGFAAFHLTSKALTGLTINGEPMQSAPAELLPAVILVTVLASVTMMAVRIVPPMGGQSP